MTPAQRQYDTELAASMRLQATQVASRSRKIADTLNAAADRIEALSALVPVDEQFKQPASASDQGEMNLNR